MAQVPGVSGRGIAILRHVSRQVPTVGQWGSGVQEQVVASALLEERGQVHRGRIRSDGAGVILMSWMGWRVTEMEVLMCERMQSNLLLERQEAERGAW